MSMTKKIAMAVALGASALTASAPASAQYYHGYRHERYDNGAGVAIGAGILGLALGAAIASGSDQHRTYRSYDNGYYNDGYSTNGYYNNGYSYDYRTVPQYNDDGYERQYRRHRAYQHCFAEQTYDRYSESWVTVQRCR